MYKIKFKKIGGKKKGGTPIYLNWGNIMENLIAISNAKYFFLVDKDLLDRKKVVYKKTNLFIEKDKTIYRLYIIDDDVGKEIYFEELIDQKGLHINDYIAYDKYVSRVYACDCADIEFSLKSSFSGKGADLFE